MRLTSKQALLLRAFAAWTIYVWTTRIWNIWRDDHDVPFKVVHSVLAVVSVAFAVAALVVVQRNRRTAAAPASEPRSDRVNV